MKKKDKLLLYSELVKLETIVLGSLWVVSGVFSLFNNTLGVFLQTLSYAIFLYTVVRVLRTKAERADEMAEQNMRKAKAFAADCTLLLFFCIAIIAILFLRDITLSISLNRLIPAIVHVVAGLYSVIIGLAFRKFEDS